MSKRIIDLSVALDANVNADPPGLGPAIEYIGHDQGAMDFDRLFGVPVEKQLDGKGAAVEKVSMTTHNGTHMDAPWHYHPTMNNGEPALTIDQIPLEWCMGPGVKLDFTEKPDGHVLSVSELQAEFARIGHVLKAGDIVLANTRAGSCYGYDNYVESGCGFGREATLWLTDNGVRVCGTDAWSWDAPLHLQVSRARASGDYSLFWEGHKAGSECIYCHIEKLTNLDLLPDHGFHVMALPVKVAGGSAGWCRAVALLDE